MAPNGFDRRLFGWIGRDWMSLTVFFFTAFIIEYIFNTPWHAALFISAIIILILYVLDLWDIVILKLYFFAEGPFRWLGRRIRWLKSDWRPAALILILVSILTSIFSGMYQLETYGKINENCSPVYNGTVKLGDWWSKNQSDPVRTYSNLVFDKMVFRGGQIHNSSPLFRRGDNNTSGSMTDLSLKNISLWNETFSEAIIRIAFLQNNTAPSEGASGAEAFNLSIRNATLKEGFVEDASVFNATLIDATLLNENPKDAKTTNLMIANASLKEAIIRNASLHNATLENVLMQRDVSMQNEKNDTSFNNTAFNNITTNHLGSTNNAQINATAYNATINIIKLKNIIISSARIREVRFENITAINLNSIGSNTTADNAVLLKATIQDFILPSEPSTAEESSLIWTLLLYAARFFDYYLSILFTQWPAILLFWSLFFLLGRAWNVHKRILIGAIEDKSGQGQDGNVIANLLAMRLSDLNDIYSRANEARSIPTSTGTDQPLQASISIPEMEFLPKLQNLVTKGAPAMLWLQPLSDVVSQIISLAYDAILSPQKIDGVLYKSKDTDNNDILILTARLSGGEQEHSWKVSKKQASQPVDSQAREERKTDKPASAANGQNPQTANNPQRTQSSQNPQSTQGTQGTQSSQSAKDPNEEKSLHLDSQIDELACRIFTDLVFNPHRRELVRWSATLSFSEGLRAYRSSLRSRLDKKIKLMEAEKRFLETLVVDERFNKVYYNLGVVYNELDRREAARIAFQRSIERSPDDWEPYYALALNYYESLEKELREAAEGKKEKEAWLTELCTWKISLREATEGKKGGTEEALLFQCNEIIELCNHALDLGDKPREQEAKIYDLIGLVQRVPEMIREGLYDLNELKPQRVELYEAIKSHKKAVRLSYEALYECELKGGENKEIRIIISKCLLNLAIDYSYNDFAEGTFYLGEMLLLKAMHLSPSLQPLYVRLGQVYQTHSLPQEAMKMMARARAMNPDSLDVLSRMLAISKEAVETSESDYLKEIFAESSSRASEQDLERINYPEKSYGYRLLKRKKCYDKLNDALEKKKIRLRDLDRKLEDSGFDDPVLFGRATILLSKYYSKQDPAKSSRSTKHCEHAIDILKLKPEEMRFSILEGLRLIDLDLGSDKRNRDRFERVFSTILQDQKEANLILNKKIKSNGDKLIQNIYSNDVTLDLEKAKERIGLAKRITSLVTKSLATKSSAETIRKDMMYFYINDASESIKQTSEYLDKINENISRLDKNFKATQNYREVMPAAYRRLPDTAEIKEIRDKLEESRKKLEGVDHTQVSPSRIDEIRDLLKEVVSILKKVEDAESSCDGLGSTKNEEARRMYEGAYEVKKAICGIEYIGCCLDLLNHASIDDPWSTELIEQIRYLFESSLKTLNGIKKEEPEFSDVCTTLGSLYLELGSSDNAKKAEHYYKAAIDALRASPLRATEMKLQNKLSRAIRYQSRLIDAQIEAEDSITLNPFDYQNRDDLAKSLWVLKDYSESRAEWENAMLLNPDEPKFRINMAINYIKEVQEDPFSHDDERLEKALASLLQSLKLIDSGNSVLRMLAHYWLGILYRERNKPDKAIYHLSISKSLAGRDEPKPDGLMISYTLAKLYINKKMYDSGEKELEKIISRGKELLGSSNIGEKSSDISDLCGKALLLQGLTIGYIMAKAHLKLSSLHTSQSVAYIEDVENNKENNHDKASFGNKLEKSLVEELKKAQSEKPEKALPKNMLDEALFCAKEADKYIDELRVKIDELKKKKKGTKFLEDEVARCEGDLWNCYGSIAYKYGIIAYKQGSEADKNAAKGDSAAKSPAEEQIDNAIRFFEASVSRYPKVRNYVYLAMACRKKIELLDREISEIRIPQGNEGNPTNESKKKVIKKQPNPSPPANQGQKPSNLQQDPKERLSRERRQKDYCIRECYKYIKTIENTGQYDEDDPEEYSAELLELKNYIEGSASAQKTIKPEQEAKEPEKRGATGSNQKQEKGGK
jgi:uncharacterized protein YjbI with pentapeptide repeats